MAHTSKCFRSFSIRTQLMLSMVIISCIALLLIITGIIAYEKTTAQKEALIELETLIDVIGWKSSAALAVNDHEAAKEMLDMVPQEFIEKAVSGTEAFAKQNGQNSVTTDVVDAYRKDLGF